MILTHERWKELIDVNFEVNKKIKYQEDMETYNRPDFWEIADDRGDCDDYVLAKRAKLEELGWDVLTDLSIALCWTEFGQYHAVLIAKTDRGDYVLDNRFDRVKPWRDWPYKWDRIQVGTEWRKICAYNK
jgi:predicted transglutaminase-like cysteine proteinase